MPNQYTDLNFPTQSRWIMDAISNHNSDDCLLWTFATNGFYGQIWFQNRNVTSHRCAFFIANGHWPTPCARHTCDNMICINPRHIIEGTHADNVADRVARNRSARGESSGVAKLTDEKVRQIRREYGYRTQVELGEQFGVTHGVISQIVNRKTWKHIL